MTRLETVARALHEAHKPFCDYTYPFDHPMASAEVYFTLAAKAIETCDRTRIERVSCENGVNSETTTSDREPNSLSLNDLIRLAR
jgi:hypothetical protein